MTGLRFIARDAVIAPTLLSVGILNFFNFCFQALLYLEPPAVADPFYPSAELVHLLRTAATGSTTVRTIAPNGMSLGRSPPAASTTARTARSRAATVTPRNDPIE